jgi:hypothetical protein
MKTYLHKCCTILLAVFLSFSYSSKLSAQSTHLNFDGINDYVSGPALNLANQSFSMEFWAKRTSGFGYYQYAFSQGAQNGGQFAGVLFRLNNVISFSFWGDDLDAATPVTDVNWHHYAVTFDAVSKVQAIYVDGVLDASRIASANTTASGTMYLGGNLGGDQTFEGDMDEFRVWNYALSPDEIASRKNCELQGTPSGLIRYYKFNQGTPGGNNPTVTSLTDAVASNNGMLIGFSLSGASSNWLSGSQVITGSAIPAAPTATSPVNYLQHATASPLTATGTNLLWYTTATGGTGSGTAPTPSTATAGTTSYWVTSSNASGCQSIRTKIDVIVSPAAAHLKFDGVNDFVNCGARTAFDFATGTVEAWVKPAASANNRVIVANRTVANGTQTRWSLHLNQASGTVGLYNGSAFTALNIGTVSAGTWYHLSFVLNASSVSVFVNGALAGSIGAGLNTSSTGNRLLIGASDITNSFPAEYWSGDIDEVRIWNRALSANEILRARDCELQGNETGLVGYYKMNQGVAAGNNAGVTTATDASANAFTGTLTNFALTGSASNWVSGSPVIIGSTMPSAPTASAQTFCGAITVANLVPAPSSTIRWYSAATGGSALSSSAIINASATYYVAGANAAGCESARVPVSITVNTTTAPTVTTPVNYVQGATPSALTATGTNLLWYTTSTGGTGSGTAPTPSTASAGTTSYWVSQTVAGCEGPRSQINVNVSAATATHLQLDGSNDYVQIVTPVTADFTIEYWVKTTQSATTGAQWYYGSGIIDAEQSGVTNDFGTSLVGSKLSFGIGNPDISIFSSSDINTGNWTHVAVSWKQSTGDMKLYINGVLEASGTSGTNARNIAPALRIGTNAYGGSYFNGSVDEVRIWNTVVSAQDIMRRKNCQLQGNESGLVAYYNFNQGFDGGANPSVTKLNDITGNAANNGTLYNFALSGTTSNWIAGSIVTTGSTVPSAPAASPRSFCGSAFVSNLFPAPGAGNRWYSAATGGSPLASTTFINTSGTYYVTAVNANGCESARTPVDITINAVTTAATGQTSTRLVVSLTDFPSCANQIARVTPSGASPINGNATARVWIETTQAPQYVKRHYQIMPASNAATATATVTLYFTQAEFDAFNAVNSIKLPTSAADAVGIANLLIEKRGGSSSNGTGLPNTYAGSVTTINPVDGNVLWNASTNRWEVTFDVVGFSGFFVKTASLVLPTNWISFTAGYDAQKNVQLEWKVSENSVLEYEVERSVDGSSFSSIGTAGSVGNGTNSYRFIDDTKPNTGVYYRIKQTDLNGKSGYSKTIRLSARSITSISVWPNPAQEKVIVTVSNELLHTKLLLQDLSGKTLRSIRIENNSLSINIGNYASGVYILKFENGETLKLVK